MITKEQALVFEFENLTAEPQLLRRFRIGAFVGDVVFQNEGSLGSLENGANVRRYDGVDEDGQLVATEIGRFTKDSASDVITVMKNRAMLSEEILFATNFSILAAAKSTT